MSELQRAKQRLLMRASSSIIEAPEEDSSEFRMYNRGGNASSIPKMNIKTKDNQITDREYYENFDEDINFAYRLSPCASKTERKSVLNSCDRYEIMSEKSQNIQALNRSNLRKQRRTT